MDNTLRIFMESKNLCKKHAQKTEETGEFPNLTADDVDYIMEREEALARMQTLLSQGKKIPRELHIYFSDFAERVREQCSQGPPVQSIPFGDLPCFKEIEEGRCPTEKKKKKKKKEKEKGTKYLKKGGWRSSRSTRKVSQRKNHKKRKRTRKRTYKPK